MRNAMRKAKRAAAYSRVSHEEQSKFGFSIQNQIDRLRKYAKEENIVIVEEYVDEGYSAGSMKRPALQEMLNNLHLFDCIIFTKLDRFTRNVLDANEMVKLFEQKGVSIIAIDEDDVDTSTADGMFMFNLKVSLAQRELKKGSERIVTVFDYKVRKGQPITGNHPFGYCIGEKDGEKTIIKDKEVAHIVEEMFDHFITHQSVRLTMEHINTKHGMTFAYNTYNKLLKKAEYTGLYRGNPDYYPPYISTETHQKVQDIMKNNIRIQKTFHTYIFSGLIRCHKCGGKTSGMYTVNRKGIIYYYYQCNKVRDRQCDTKRVSEKKVEKFLVENINRLVSEYIVEASVEIEEKPKAAISAADILEDMDRLTYAYRKKRISQKEYDYEFELLEKQLADLKRQMPEKKDLSGLQSFLQSGWENIYHNLDKEEKRALFRTVIREIVLNEDGGFDVTFV